MRGWSFSLKRVICGIVPACGVWIAASCAPAPTISNVRSLDGSGKASLLCLSAPADQNPFRRVSDCTHVADSNRTIGDFGPSQGGSGGGSFTGGTDVNGQVPHLYAMVTQTVRGEVAMVDLTATVANVLDFDASTPGNNLLPVGLGPTDIVSTPGATATFVATADVERPAIYAIPTRGLRDCALDPASCSRISPTISSWPACILPAQPGAMILLVDPPGGTGAQTRASCDSLFQDLPDVSSDPKVPDLIDREGNGRQKLVVALPTLGELAVIDAQAVLEAAPGSTGGCVIERTLPLEADVKPTGAHPGPPKPACVYPRAVPPGAAVTYVPQPAQMTMADGRLYISDIAAPVIHVVDAVDPCDMNELPPLLATSKEDPTRVVTTDSLSVTPRLTASNKRYLYATDIDDKSLMVFDVSEGSLQTTPLETPNGELNPLQPVDRIRFAAEPKAVQIMVRDQPKGGADHLAPFGTLCNPIGQPGCTDSSAACEGEAYRTAIDYTSGAGPLTLRGMFALAALSSGQLVVTDIEDYDQPCRGPNDPTLAVGCPVPGTGLFTSSEGTCGVVYPNEPRSNNYILSNDTVGRHLPGISTFPLLFDKDSTLLDITPGVARMHAPDQSQSISVNGVAITPDGSGLLEDDSGTPQNGLLMNLVDPRVHTADQDWTVTFEGPLPGLSGQLGSLHLADVTAGSARQLIDSPSRFCSVGVQSFAAEREKLAASGLTGDALDSQAEAIADRVTITNPLLDSANAYWMSTSACTFEACSATFGDDTTPTPNRDIVIHEAYDDHLDLEAPSVDDALVKCCFPTLVNFEIRPASQWVVVGGSTGFLHHVIADTSADPNNAGRCRDSCDPRLDRLTGRVRVTEDEKNPRVLLSPQFRFYITSSPASSTERGSRRGDQFKLTTEGSFQGLSVLLTNTSVTAFQTQSIAFLPDVDRIMLTDGALEGIYLVDGTLQGTPTQIY